VTEPDVFLVRSPFQVVNAREAAVVYGSVEPRICVLASGPNETRQVAGIIERAGFGHVEWSDRIDDLVDRIGPSAGRVFLGDYREPEQRWFARRLGSRRPIVLDDGNATLMVAHRRSHAWWRFTDRRVMSLSAPSHHRRFPIPTILRDLREPASREYGSVEFFSIYEVGGTRRDRYRANTLAWLRSQIEAPTSTRAVFIGSPLVEADFMAPEPYRARVQDAAATSDGQLLYIAHRRERDENLAVLRDDVGVEILRPDVPIELVLLDRRIQPSRIVAVLSSAYDTLRMIFPDAPASWVPPFDAEVAPAFREPLAMMVALTRSAALATAGSVGDRGAGVRPE
jgi:hypothetical protein